LITGAAAAATPTVWYCADKGVDRDASGRVTVWRNQGSLGSAADLAGKGAAWAADAHAGKGAVRFDGTGHLQTRGPTDLGFSAKGGTWFCVFDVPETATPDDRVNRGVFGLAPSPNGSRTGLFFPHGSGGLHLRFWALGSVDGLPSSTKKPMLIARAATGTPWAGVLHVGHFCGFPWAKDFVGDVAELRFYGAKLTDAEIEGVKRELAAKWDAVEPGNDPSLLHGAPRVQAKAELIWTRSICPSKDRYIGWPTICRTRDGELLATFSGDREEHVCPWGKVMMVRSKDGGETWSAPVIIHNSTVDDRDSGIMELADGTFVVTWFSSICFAGNRSRLDWCRHFEKISQDELVRDVGYFTRRSTDRGRTWEPPVRTLGSANHGGIQLKSGRLVMVGRFHNAEGNLVKGFDDPRLKLGNHALTVEVSDDGARSWRLLATIQPQAPYELNKFHEPYLIELDDGTLLAQFRYHGGTRRTLQSESSDGGKTWAPIHETGLIGYPSHLLKLKDGRLLSTYGCRIGGKFGQRAALSNDNGKTWDVENEINLCLGFSGDLGYPSTVQLDDGTLVSAYYQAFRPGESPSLMATKWQLTP